MVINLLIEKRKIMSFERSDVEATLTAPIVNIKNRLFGHIDVPEVSRLWILKMHTEK